MSALRQGFVRIKSRLHTNNPEGPEIMRKWRRSSVRRSRTRSSVATVALLVSAFAVPITASDGSPAVAFTPAAASAQAVATGAPVPVTSLTDEYSTTTAEPDGSFTRRMSVEPVRAERDGEWVALDAELRQNADGTWSPTTSTNPLALSNGGSTPLADLTADGSRLQLTWPTPLPRPSAEGTTLTYPEVLGGVDLQVTADDQGGISEVLVVQNAVAARNPALDSLRLLVRTTNATVHDDAAGNISVTDSTGAEAWHAPTPLMWDSGSDAGQAADPAVSDPAAAPPADATVAQVDVDATSSSITLVPDQSLLEDPETTFPVFIDPSFIPTNGTGAGFAWVQEANAGTSWWNTNRNGTPAVGYQGWDPSYQGRNRAYYQFSIGSLGAAHISSATLQLTETDTGSWSCSASYDIDVYSSGHIGSSTTWNNQPARSSLQDGTNVSGAAPEGGCSKKTFRWTVTSSVAADGDGTVTYDVQAPSAYETDRNYYRRFGSTSGDAADLSINYNWPPNVPTSPSLSPAPQSPSSGCNLSPTGWIGSQDDGNITLSAHVSDKDQNNADHPQPAHLDFSLWDKGGDGKANPTISVFGTGDSEGHTVSTTTYGATLTKAVSTTELTNGHLYGWDAWADDGIDTSSSSSDHCYFWYDSASPVTNKPTSADFKSDGTGTVTVGQTGQFTITGSDPIPSGASYSKIDHFNYEFGTSSGLDTGAGTPVPVNPTGSAATATFAYTPANWGMHTLYVDAVDNAGNGSAVATYSFYVPDNGTFAVSPGDVDGDARPDLLGAAPSTGSASDPSSLYLFRTTATAGTTALPTPKLASTPDQSPDGVTWAGTLLAHRLSDTGTGEDDLWAMKAGSLDLYTNNLYAAEGLSDPDSKNLYFSYAHAIPVTPPACTGTCTAYTQTWSDVSDMISIGDWTGDGKPDLVMVKTGGTGSLWFFPSTQTSGVLGNAQLIGSSGWSSWELIAPGDSNGDGIPDLWARSTATSGTAVGQLREYPIGLSAAADGSTIVKVNAPNTDGGATWGPASRRLVTSPGDTDADGLPELYEVVGSTLWQNEETKRQSATAFGMTAHSVIDDGTGAVTWSSLTSLS
jgi:FG-GAP-like repeat